MTTQVEGSPRVQVGRRRDAQGRCRAWSGRASWRPGKTRDLSRTPRPSRPNTDHRRAYTACSRTGRRPLGHRAGPAAPVRNADRSRLTNEDQLLGIRGASAWPTAGKRWQVGRPSFPVAAALSDNRVSASVQNPRSHFSQRSDCSISSSCLSRSVNSMARRPAIGCAGGDTELRRLHSAS